MLGLVAQVGEIPSRPDGPAVACRVRVKAKEATVLVSSSDATANTWVVFGKFTLPVTQENGKADIWRFADGLSEGMLNRLVRAQMIKGSATKDKGKLVYQLRDRQRIAAGPEWAGDAGNGEQRRGDAEGAVDVQRFAAQEPDGADQ